VHKLPFHLRLPVFVQQEGTQSQDEHVQAQGQKLPVVRVGKQHVADVHDEQDPYVLASARAYNMLVQKHWRETSDVKMYARCDGKACSQCLLQCVPQRQTRNEQHCRDVKLRRGPFLSANRLHLLLGSHGKVAGADVLVVYRDVKRRHGHAHGASKLNTYETILCEIHTAII
jgi:hypothetical protein